MWLGEKFGGYIYKYALSNLNMFKFLKEKIGGWLNKLKPEEKPSEKSKKPKKLEKKLKKEKISKEKVKKTSVKDIGKKLIEDIKKEQEIKKQYEAEEIQEKVEEEIKLETKKPGFFSKLFGQTEQEEAKDKSSIFSFFKSKISKEKFEELFSELELVLLQNNVALQAVESIKQQLSNEIVGKSPSEIDIKISLKKAIESILIAPQNFTKLIKESLKTKKPFIIIFVGINGSGKTTTIAKVANLLKKEKISTCLVAADTFRAASIEQLEQHATRLNVPLIKKDYGSDPASVGFDAISYAKKRNLDVVLVDTAGRMNTKDSLMKEMEKIVRVCQPDMKIFIGESITGNDATEQAKAFNDLINLTGVILSKADVDEKGGTAISISKVTGKPIFFLGTGQAYNDLEVFSKEKIISQLGLD